MLSCLLSRQACEQVYLQCLAAHGITAPKLPPAPAQRSINASAAELQCSSSAASSCGGSSSSAAAYTQLLQRLGSGGAAGHNTGSLEGIVGSPGSHVSWLVECRIRVGLICTLAYEVHNVHKWCSPVEQLQLCFLLVRLPVA